MVIILDDLSHEEQKLFGELYDDNGRRVIYCRGIYITRDNEGNISLMNIEDDTLHCCASLEAIRGYYQRENW